MVFDAEKEALYLRAVCEEIKMSAKELEGRRVRTVYFGGGTPSVIPAAHIETILEALKNNIDFENDCEISIEMNPGTVGEESLKTYLSSGINRFSMGMQSASDRELKALGRIHDNEDLLLAFDLLRRLGAENINLDIMTGIPHQTLDSLQKTLDEALSLKPSHISAYALIIEPGTPFYKTGREGLDLCGEDEEMRMYEYTVKRLEESGYERYEISNYALEKMECAHNLAYWDCLDYIGFGAAAASRIKNRRFTNTDKLYEYLKNPVKNRAEDLCLSEKELMSEFIFMGMRKIKGISVNGFFERFNEDIFKAFGPELEKYIKQGLIIHDGDRLKFSSRGLDVSNMILSDFV